MIQGYTDAVSLPTEYPYFGEQSPEYQFPDIFGQQSIEYGPYMPGARWQEQTTHYFIITM